MVDRPAAPRPWADEDIASAERRFAVRLVLSRRSRGCAPAALSTGATSTRTASPFCTARKWSQRHLTASEKVSLARIRAEGDVRLEQERIPWEVALGVVRAAIGSAHGAEYLIHPVHEPRG